MLLKDKEKILFIGDSITDAGRNGSGDMTPWDLGTGLGSGYVNQFNALVANEFLDRRIRVINKGVSGNTVLDLEKRWQKDVLDTNPDWLSVAIGVNDVWRQFDTPMCPERAVPPEVYRAVYSKLIQSAKAHCNLKGLILMTPFVAEPNQADPFRKRMDEYGAIVAELASELNAFFVDTQAVLDALMHSHFPCELAWDRIHVNTVGHYGFARALVKILS